MREGKFERRKGSWGEETGWGRNGKIIGKIDLELGVSPESNLLVLLKPRGDK